MRHGMRAGANFVNAADNTDSRGLADCGSASAAADPAPGPGRGVAAAALQHHPDPFTHPGVVGDRIQTEYLDHTAIGPDESLAHLDGRRLAGAVGPEQGEYLRLVHLEVQTRYRRGRPIVLGDSAQPHRSQFTTKRGA